MPARQRFVVIGVAGPVRLHRLRSPEFGSTSAAVALPFALAARRAAVTAAVAVLNSHCVIEIIFRLSALCSSLLPFLLSSRSPLSLSSSRPVIAERRMSLDLLQNARCMGRAVLSRKEMT